MKRNKTSLKVQTEDWRSLSSSVGQSRKLRRSADPRPDRSVRFTEVSGKILDYICYTGHETAQQAVEIRFTDGTFLYLEPLPQVSFRARYLKTHRGSIQSVRDYGVLPE